MALKPTVEDKHMTRSGIHRALKTLEEGKFLHGYHQLIKQSEAAKYALMEIAVELITDEVSAASLSPLPLLGDFSASGLESFNWIQTLAEYERICPLLLACLRAALTTKQGQRGSTRDQETVNPAIGVILSLIFYMSAPERYKIQNHIEALASWIPHWENKTPKPKKAPESSSFTKPSPRAKRSKTSQQKPPKQPTPEKLYHKTKVMYGTNIIENLEMDVSEENSTTDLASVIKQEETVISQSNASSEGDQSGFLIEINQSEAFSEGDQPGSTMKISKSQALSALTGFSQSEPPFDDDLAGHDNSSGLSDAVEESALNRTAEVGTESFDSPWTDRPQAPGDSTVCPTCGKTLRDKYSLQRHLNLHNGGNYSSHVNLRPPHEEKTPDEGKTLQDILPKEEYDENRSRYFSTLEKIKKRGGERALIEYKKFLSKRSNQYRLSMTEQKKQNYNEKVKIRMRRLREKKRQELQHTHTLTWQERENLEKEIQKKREQWREQKQAYRERKQAEEKNYVEADDKSVLADYYVECKVESE